jgi:tetratricopeptide (TPR) repeat protein
MVSSPRIDELKKKFDENPRRYFAPLANEYRKAGDLEQAIQLCRAYLPQQPGHMSGHIVFGQALFESGQLEEAKGVFETALTLDPENLIALRHLGDIALQGGDPATARQWYQRVLDADPRNEEIAAQIAALDAARPETPAAASDGPTPTAEGGMAGWGDINPEQPAAGQQAAATPPGRSGAGVELRDSISMPSIPPIPAPASPRTPAAPPPEPKAPQRLELERDGEGAFAPPNPAAATRALEGVERSEEVDLRPRTSPAIETSPTGEAVTGHAPDAAAGPPADRDERANMQSFGSSNAFGFETMEFVPPPREHEAPTAGSTPSGFGVPFTGETPASATETPEAFVTETMAELYLQQGFTQEALAVYRQLLSKNPNDRGLLERVASLEGGRRSSVAAAAVSDEVIEHAQRRNARGPETIRSFFAALMRRRVLQRYEDSDEARVAGERADAAAEAAYGEALGASNAEPAGAGYEQHGAPWTSGDSASTTGVGGEVLGEEALDDVPTGDDAHALDDAFIVPDGVPLPPGVTAHSHDEHPHPAPAPESVDEFEAAPSDASTPSQDDAYAAALYTPTDAEPAAREEGTIDLLFNGNGASSEDEHAASVLSGAFPAVESQTLGGRPAERATTELSLDHVFREADRKTGRASAGFSFDQFFSESGTTAQKQTPRPTDPGGTAVGGPDLAPDDDVAQFNDWLTGLKKK